MPRPAITDKIQGRHRDRLAVVYIRQSTLQQVGRHPESTRLQYALAERARQLGWARERIVVIDDDLGRSGSSASTISEINKTQNMQLFAFESYQLTASFFSIVKSVVASRR